MVLLFRKSNKGGYPAVLKLSSSKLMHSQQDIRKHAKRQHNDLQLPCTVEGMRRTDSPERFGKLPARQRDLRDLQVKVRLDSCARFSDK